jgi:hypothetical protein
MRRFFLRKYQYPGRQLCPANDLKAVVSDRTIDPEAGPLACHSVALLDVCFAISRRQLQYPFAGFCAAPQTQGASLAASTQQFLDPSVLL